MTLEICGVTKRYGGAVALDDLSVRFATGRLTVLLGPDGGGAATLLALVAGIDHPDDGGVYVDGVDLVDLAPDHRPVLLGAAELLAGWAPPTDGPSVLLLDEPFAGLDPAARQRVRERLEQLRGDDGLTVVVHTHHPGDVLPVADEVVVVACGRVEQAGSPASVYDEPRSDVVMELLGDVTHLGGEAVRPHEVEVSRHPTDVAAYAGTVAHQRRLGRETRLTVLTDDGEVVEVDLSPERVAALALGEGDTVYVSAAARRPHAPCAR